MFGFNESSNCTCVKPLSETRFCFFIPHTVHELLSSHTPHSEAMPHERPQLRLWPQKTVPEMNGSYDVIRHRLGWDSPDPPLSHPLPPARSHFPKIPQPSKRAPQAGAISSRSEAFYITLSPEVSQLLVSRVFCANALWCLHNGRISLWPIFGTSPSLSDMWLYFLSHQWWQHFSCLGYNFCSKVSQDRMVLSVPYITRP